MKSRFLLVFSVSAALALIGVMAVTALVPRHPFEYDEADYMFAANQGLLANYLDIGVIPFTRFIEKGMESGFDKSRFSELSAFMRETGDVSFYRHNHGPLYFYALRIWSLLVGNKEAPMRWLGPAILALTAVACAMVLPWQSAPAAVALAALLVALGALSLGTALQVNPHILFMPMVVVTLGLFSRCLEGRRQADCYGGLITLALSFAVLELAVLMAAAFAVCAVLRRKDLGLGAFWPPPMKLLFPVVLICFAALLVVWPGGILKLTLVKNFLSSGYFALVRSGMGAYGSSGVLDAWLSRFAGYPVTFSLIWLSVLISIFILFKRRDSPVLPFAVYQLLFLVVLGRNPSPVAKYFSSLWVASAVLVGYALVCFTGQKLHRMVKLSLVGVIGLLVVGESAWFIKRRLQHEAAGKVMGFSWLADLERERRTLGELLFVWRDLAPTVHYYMPAVRARAYNTAYKDFNGIADDIKASLKPGSSCSILMPNHHEAKLAAALRQRGLATSNPRSLAVSPVGSRWILLAISIAPP